MAIQTTKDLYNEISAIRDSGTSLFRFLACMKAPLKRIQNKFRYQVIMRVTAKSEELINKIYKRSIAYDKKDVGVFVEVNPNNLN